MSVGIGSRISRFNSNAQSRYEQFGNLDNPSTFLDLPELDLMVRGRLIAHELATWTLNELKS